MYEIKSRGGRWSVSLCDCSQDTAHVHYRNVVLHIALGDLRELGLAMQSVAEGAAATEQRDNAELKKGMVQ